MCIDSENVMATAEQTQEALQQLQAQGARIAALETQLQIESARAQPAEQERSALIHTLGAMRTDRGGAMVDTKGIGQPFLLKGLQTRTSASGHTQSAHVHACKVRR